MSGDDIARSTAILLCLVLAGSSLLARRTPLGPTLRMAGAWAGIFIAGFTLFAWWPDLAQVGRRVLVAGDPASGVVSGDTLRVPLAADGHYWIRGAVDDVEVRFLVDSGATTTALSAATARAAGLEPSSPLPVTIETANGDVEALPVRIGRLKVGPITSRSSRAVMSEAFGDTNVLGMNFLSGLKRWGVEDGTLVLVP